MLQTLRERLPNLSSPAAAAAEQLLSRGEVLLARVRELCSGPASELKTRIHGNLHPGKVLLVADDFLITGFEGDSSLPLPERRRRDSPLYDVATVLRSFDHARATALDRALMGRPDLHDRLEPALADWLHATTHAFLKGYRGALQVSACAPTDEHLFARLLTLFQISRALRELQQELDHHPARSTVPLHALLKLTE